MNVFILGLDHSRSTIVDLYLGEKFSYLSLGEVRRTLFPIRNEKLKIDSCACGKNFHDCGVWELITSRDYKTTLLDTELQLIDSSKDLAHYVKFRDNVDLVVVTYRSFKNWYPSVVKSLTREGRHGLNKIFKVSSSSDLRLYMRNFRLLAFLEYLTTHIRICFILVGRRKTLIASSEDLENVQLQFNDGYLLHGNHIVRGNRISKSSDIRLRKFDESDIFSKILNYLWR